MYSAGKSGNNSGIRSWKRNLKVYWKSFMMREKIQIRWRRECPGLKRMWSWRWMIPMRRSQNWWSMDVTWGQISEQIFKSIWSSRPQSKSIGKEINSIRRRFVPGSSRIFIRCMKSSRKWELFVNTSNYNNSQYNPHKIPLVCEKQAKSCINNCLSSLYFLFL